MPRLEDIPLEEQISMPTSWQRELKERPENRRGENARNESGGQCTRYFKRTDPATGKTEWKILTGQPCGPPPPARTIPAPVPAAEKPTPAPVACSRAFEWINWGAAYRVGDSNQPGSAWINQAQQLLRSTPSLCADETQAINDEITRLLRNFGGSAAAVPIQIAPLISYYMLALRPQQSRPQTLTVARAAVSISNAQVVEIAARSGLTTEAIWAMTDAGRVALARQHGVL